MLARQLKHFPAPFSAGELSLPYCNQTLDFLRRAISHYFATTSSSPELPKRLAEGPGLADFLTTAQTVKQVAAAAASGRRPSVFIETYGCQQNTADSEIVYRVLATNGYHQASTVDQANVVLLNTCSIREKAEAKIFSRLGMLRKSTSFTEEGPVIGVLGCMAERLKEKLLGKQRLADLVVGPDAYRDLPRILGALQAGQANRKDAVNVQLSLEETYADIHPLRPANATSAFLSIMRGCNNMCTFCIVPFTRGRERSRPLQSILDEVKLLAESGVKEVTLLGQNVNSYADFSQPSQWSSAATEVPFGVYAENFKSVYKPKRGGAVCFAELLDRVAAIDPEMRIWFTSPHPKDFSDQVLEVIQSRHNIAKMVHMPAQSGSSRMLEAMRRGYTREAYDNLAHKIRAKIPGVALSTDMISGFCGETQADHEASVDLMCQTAYEQAFMFAYSRRDGTYAARHLQDDVPVEEKNRRLNEIISVFKDKQAERAAAEIGRHHLVLVEGESKDGGLLTGKSASMKRIKFPDTPVTESLKEANHSALVKAQAGDYVAVEVTGSRGGNLIGRALAKTSTLEFAEVHGSVTPSKNLTPVLFREPLRDVQNNLSAYLV